MVLEKITDFVNLGVVSGTIVIFLGLLEKVFGNTNLRKGFTNVSKNIWVLQHSPLPAVQRQPSPVSHYPLTGNERSSTPF